MPQLLSVQTGTARRLKIGDSHVLTAFHKQSVDHPVAVSPLGLMGDEQADLSVHGGLEKAVYAYPAEHYDFWKNARREAGVSPLDDRLEPGSLGENLTLQGLLETDVWVGDVLKFRACELRVTLPREPCFKFAAAMGFSRAVRLMAQNGLCGFYLSVSLPGTLRAGETFELVPGRRSVSLTQLASARLAKHLR